MGCSCKKSCSSSCSCSSCSSSCDPCTQVCAALVVSNAWNVPACDDSAVLYVPGLTTVLIGSYISNPTYGAFRITSINSTGGKITVVNECLPDNAVPGTVVPAFTTFVFGTPPTVTEYSTWVPVVTASGAMTVSALTIDQASYFLIGTTCFFDLTVRFTLGGVASITVNVSPPLTGTSHSSQTSFPANVADNSGAEPGAGWRIEGGGTVIAVGLSAAANWSLGAGASINIQGRFQTA